MASTKKTTTKAYTKKAKIKSCELVRRVENGWTCYRKKHNGKLHREDGPAFYNDTSRSWYFNGKLHREGGPALINSEGQHWYKRGKLHRLDGPATTYNGIEIWYLEGKRHRVGGPAEYGNGVEVWYQNGVRHREDGPAEKYIGEPDRFYVNGTYYSEAEFYKNITNNRKVAILTTIEDFTDKYGEKSPKEAATALLSFLQGDCQHAFRNKNKECELCG